MRVLIAKCGRSPGSDTLDGRNSSGVHSLVQADDVVDADALAAVVNKGSVKVCWYMGEPKATRLSGTVTCEAQTK